ncbi:hypothetical protein DICVIV_08337 [Dictyocaulus viviparus]|uniref:Uncharacterized protein n=1 Tax=Dictyocaulus viviparus TaxID=29172 RepID=A0A0D8XT92_DICVI|nr:hypothetical protein DICVIV_08337 [Dictyocaulus viviparus]
MWYALFKRLKLTTEYDICNRLTVGSSIRDSISFNVTEAEKSQQSLRNVIVASHGEALATNKLKSTPQAHVAYNDCSLQTIMPFDKLGKHFNNAQRITTNKFKIIAVHNQPTHYKSESTSISK